MIMDLSIFPFTYICFHFCVFESMTWGVTNLTLLYPPFELSLNHYEMMLFVSSNSSWIKLCLPLLQVNTFLLVFAYPITFHLSHISFSVNLKLSLVPQNLLKIKRGGQLSTNISKNLELKANIEMSNTDKKKMINVITYEKNAN